MKKKISQIIKILGIGLSELVIDIELDTVTINSVELSLSEKKIYLHIFNDDIDIEMDFDDMTKENQEIILKKLSELIYN